jgi:hypothetical protein
MTIPLLNYENRQVRKAENGEIIVQYLQTTTGRAILNIQFKNFKFFYK